jgi:hypothetical protein
MSAQVRTRSTGLLASAVVAGILGGILIDAFLALSGHRSPVVIWQFIASTIVGKSAFASPSAAVLGFCVHFAVSIAWAILYAYLFAAAGQLRNWIAGAIVWGIVVDAGMTLILSVKIGAPFGSTFTHGLPAHIVFYALPVAFYLARTVRRA